jgi:hypothetical protein
MITEQSPSHLLTLSLLPNLTTVPSECQYGSVNNPIHNVKCRLNGEGQRERTLTTKLDDKEGGDDDAQPVEPL